jgi:hypothetical protein
VCFSQAIDGIVKDKNGNNVSNTLIILEELKGDGKGNVNYLFTKENGEFHFEAGREPGHYRLVAYKDGNIKEEKIIYLGKGSDNLKITIGEKWYELKWLDKIWVFVSLLTSFCLGLFSSNVLEFLKRKRIQKNISRFYNESIGEFKGAINTISDADGEEKYNNILDKLAWAKANLETLLGYSWSVERLESKFFYQLKEKYHFIQELEKSPAFKTGNHFSDKIFFLRKLREGKTPEQQYVCHLIDKLEITK